MDAIPSYLFPETAAVGNDGALTIGGVSLLDIAAEYGTPAFVYDETHIINRCREAVAAFPSGVAYASKAFLCKAIARIAADAGMSIDVASEGELHVALAAGVDPGQVIMHGNNKSEAELKRAMELDIGLVVIDSFDELRRIKRLVKAKTYRPIDCLVRVTPGIEAHTHEYIMTGQDDSKFGFSLASGDAQWAVDLIRQSRALNLVGAHAHIGSLIFETEAFERAVEVLAPFVNDNQFGQLCIGGGLGIPYVAGESAPTITDWAAAVHKAAANSPLDPSVMITAEPGRSIVGAASVTLYTAGTIKEIPGVRTFLSVDGGWNDNPRPVLYGSGYEAFLPRAPNATRDRTVTIMGKHCESGDTLVRDAQVPSDTRVGDIVATPVTGAYGYSMASNYNRLLRPAVVMVKDGNVRTVIRRETLDDLLLTDIG